MSTKNVFGPGQLKARAAPACMGKWSAMKAKALLSDPSYLLFYFVIYLRGQILIPLLVLPP